MSNRVMNRRGARELTAEERDQVAGGQCFFSICTIGPPPSTHTRVDDIVCE